MFGRILFFLTLCILVLTSSLPALAKNYQDIDAPTLKAMMDKGEALVVFPLSKIEYNNLHIRGSVNIDLENIAKELPADKSRKIVFYCLGEKCTASWRAAEKAVNLGYTDIYTFRAGLPAWVAVGYPTETIEKLPEVKLQKISTDDLQSMLLRDPDLVLLDVCLEVDARKFWIDSPKRIHIPADDMQERYGNIPRGKKVAVICLKGTRAPTIIRYLTAKGYKNLLLVEGGMQKWIMEGKPVKTSG
jgi:rhodanese-related sulfurtransferase